MTGITLQRWQWEMSHSKLHCVSKLETSICHTVTLLCCTAEQTFSHRPKCLQRLSHSMLSDPRIIWLSSAGSLRNAHPDPSDRVLHPGFVWELVCLEKWHSLLSRSCSNWERTPSHPWSPQDLSAKRPEETITQTEKTFTLQKYLHHASLDQRLLEVNTRPWHYQQTYGV